MVFSRIKILASVLFFFLGSHLISQNIKPTHLFELKTRKDFDMMKGLPLTENFKGIECVKIIYVLADKKLYYLDSKKYRWHYRFAQEVLEDPDELLQFNTKNYSNSSERKYILATFNYNVNTKNYFMQFSVADNPTDDQIDELTEKVAATFFWKDKFKILLNSTILLRRKKIIALKHEVITSDELFKKQVYQPICHGKARGILRYVDADSIKQSTNYGNAILILRGSSNQIPVCKGLVTNEFQTPLSHICLLTNNRKTPAAALKNIMAIDSLKKFQNKLVELTVSNDKCSIRPAQSVELNNKIVIKPAPLVTDTINKLLADLNTLGYTNKKSYGSKVCNLAELKKPDMKAKNISTPADAFGIPFYYYRKHLQHYGIDDMIQKLAKDTMTLHNDSLLDKALKKIRSAIRKNPLDKTFLEEVTKMCTARFGKNKIRFRSSSNCEDESGFNGAGLYASQTGRVGDTAKSIEVAIKKVWASLWSNRAFREREFFHIDHSGVSMAVLVHGAFDNEYANGVAITKNLYRNIDYGFVINIQKGEEEVVSPKQGVVCEQVVSYMNSQVGFYNDNRSADWISFSSLVPAGSLLNSEELYQLTIQLESIKRHFYNLYKPKAEYKNFAMDVEFKIIEGSDKKKRVAFKQARPYNN